MAKFDFRVNGTPATVESWDPDQPLLYVLPPVGAGEAAAATVAAALGNAIFDATGARLRTAPFTPARVIAALKRP